MIRSLLSAFGLAALVAVALWSAQTKIHNYSSLAPLHVGLKVDELSFLGEPNSASERELVYVLPDHSTLVIALEDGIVSAAWLDLRQPLKIEDPQFKQLRFVRWESMRPSPRLGSTPPPPTEAVFLKFLSKVLWKASPG